MNGASPTAVTRAQLYEMIWTEPTRTVAGRLGMSDVGLAKICRKFHIPRPWRGYWREKETGRKPRQPKLPAWPAHLGPEPQSITFQAASPPGEPPAPRRPEPESVQQQGAFEALPEHQIVVADTLTDPDRLVRRAGRLLKRPGDRGRLWAREHPCLDISVTPSSLDRALRVFDAILKALPARGWPVTIQAEHPFHTRVTVLNEAVSIGITEKTRQVELAQLRTKDSIYVPRYERFRYEPTGQLTVRLTDGPSFAYGAMSWSDGKRQRVEDCLHKVMIGMVQIAERQKAARLETERRRLEWLEEERGRIAAAQRLEREKDRREELRRQMDAWSRGHEVRAYLGALREAAKEHAAQEPDGRLARWIRWAESYANRIDPLLHVQQLPRDPEGYGRTPLDLADGGLSATAAPAAF